MSGQNTASGYGWIAIALHWLAAIGLVAMVLIAWNAEGENRRALMGLHFALGVTIAPLLIWRIAAHYLTPQPTPLAQPRPLQILAKATHHLLLIAVLIMIVSGPLQVLANARDIDVWGLFTIESPFATRNEGVAGIANNLHGVGRAMLYVLIPLHIIGAFKHWLFDRAGLRMLAPGR